MNKNVLLNGELYINYLGPFSALFGNLVATPILISNLGIEEWSLFALVNILSIVTLNEFFNRVL